MSSPPPPWQPPSGGPEPAGSPTPGWGSAPPPPPPGYGAGPDYYAQAPVNRDGGDLASWALGLSIIPCFFPLTTIAAIVLGIIALSRGGKGRGKAIAALVIASAWIVGVVVLAANGTLARWFEDKDSSSTGGATSSSSDGSDFVAPADVRVGDCLIDPSLLDLGEGETTTVLSLTRVSCEEPHGLEAYADTELDAGDYPGDNAVQLRANRFCAGEFGSFVGVGPRKSRLSIYFYLPTKLSWSSGSRRITCLVSEDTDTTVGTLRHTRR